MTAITDNRVAGKVEAVIRHYFDSNVNTLFDDHNNIAMMGLWAFFGSLIPAFFTVGITNSQGEPFVSGIIVVFGIGLFMGSAVIHGLLFTLGSFYKNGVFKTVGLTVLAILAIIAYVIALAVGNLGGFFLSLVIGTALPSFGVLAPFKIILFAVPSIWWFSKGWQLTVEFKSIRDTFEREINWLKSHGVEV